MLNRAVRQRGVSLIEIMVGLAIIAILLSLGTPSFIGFIQNTHVRNAAESIQNGLSLARAEAVRRNTGVQFALANDFSWTVGCETPVGDTDEDGMDDCPAVLYTKPAAEAASRASVASSELVAATGAPVTPGFANTLVFNGLGKVSTLPLTDIAVFDISNRGAGACLAADGAGKVRCLRVAVTPAGQVRMCDPLLPATNPQAC